MQLQQASLVFVFFIVRGGETGDIGSSPPSCWEQQLSLSAHDGKEDTSGSNHVNLHHPLTFSPTL